MRAAAAAIRNLAEGPDWPLLAVAGLAWAILLAAEQIPGAPPICAAAGVDPVAMAHFWLFSMAGWGGPVAVFAALIAMPVAMTAPLLQTPLGHVRRSALYERRARAVVLFLTGHLSVWAVTAAALMGLGFGLGSLVSFPIAATGVAIAAGLVWQGTPYKLIARNRTHVRLPLPACGAQADAAALRYGARSAAFCAASCWPLMLAPMTTGRAHLAMMAAAAALMLCERTARPIGAVLRWRWIGAGLAVGTCVVTGLLVSTP
jgi:predicted metal-binding membrane protein